MSPDAPADGNAAQQRAAEAEVTARRERDRAATALEEAAALRDELDAAHRLNAEALRRVEGLARELHEAHLELDDRQRYVESLEAQITAFRDGRIARYTAAPRKLGSALRRKPKPAADPEAT
jgi:chromosome segregation ATPase